MGTDEPDCISSTDVSLHWLNRDLFTVRTLVKEGSGIGGRALYEVIVFSPKNNVNLHKVSSLHLLSIEDWI